MIAAHIDWILYITGGVTAVVVLQFFFPKFYAGKVLKLPPMTDAGRFYFAHWGLLVGCIAVLLIMAAGNEAMRKPVVLMAAIEKGALAGWVWLHIGKAYTKQLIPAAVFDTLCVVVYTLFLLGF